MQITSWSALVLLFFLGASRAVVPSPIQVPDSAAPTFIAYTARDGLSDEIWSALGIDRHGFVWAGSASQLARFDGYKWVLWDFPGKHGLVGDMLADDDGNLWATLEGEGLARYDGTRWQLWDKPRANGKFSVVTAGEQREFWMNDGDGLARLQGGTWLSAAQFQIPDHHAINLQETDTVFGERRQWAGTLDDGLWYRVLSPSPGPWTRFEHAGISGLVSNMRRSMDANNEELWVLSRGGLARIRSDGVRIWTAEAGELPTRMIYSIEETHDSNGVRSLWIATRAGLVRIRHDRLAVFDRSHGLPSNAIRHLKVQRVDGIDILWVATEGGIARAALTEGAWQTVSLLGARDNGVFGLLLEPDGMGSERLWAGSLRDGLALLEGGQWRYFTRKSGTLPAQPVRGIWRIPDATGRMRRLLGAHGSPLLEIQDDLRIRALPSPWAIDAEDTPTDAVARTVDGVHEWWIAMRRSGIHRLSGGVWQSYASPDSSDPWSVYGLRTQIDSAGRAWLWAATSHGVARFDGQAWQLLSARMALPDTASISATLFERAGRQELWVSTMQAGILRLDVTNPQQPRLISDDTLPPTPDPTAYSILADQQGRLYVCTNNGVQQLTPQPGGGYSERVFHRPDGLLHDECNAGSQMIDAHGRYWVGTLGGLAMFDPHVEHVSTSPRPKPLRVTALRIDGESVAIPETPGLSVNPGVQELRVEFTLLAGIHEQETRYRSQLLGYDAAPTGWLPGRARTFTHLPPGDYVLRVEGRDYAGTASVPLSVRLHVLPAWYQHAWLQSLTAAVIALLVVGAIAYRDRTLRRAQVRLEVEIAQRTAELRVANDRLTDLSFLDALTGVANRRRLTQVLDATIEHARERQRPFGLIVLDVDHFKRYNDQHGHLVGDTALRAIAHTIAAAMRPHDLVARFGGEEFVCLLIDADSATVLQVAERIRLLVEALPPHALGNDTQTVTVSVGALSRVPQSGEDASSLLNAADSALYIAKTQGRNRVVLHGS